MINSQNSSSRNVWCRADRPTVSDFLPWLAQRRSQPGPAWPKSNLELPPFRPTEGRIAIVTDAGRDAVDAAALGMRGDGGAGRKAASDHRGRRGGVLARDGG